MNRNKNENDFICAFLSKPTNARSSASDVHVYVYHLLFID